MDSVPLGAGGAREEAVPRPHAQDVELCFDVADNSWCLVHNITLERVSLPRVPGHTGSSDEYDAHFDADGFGVVANSAGWHADFDDLFKIQVFEAAEGQYFFLSRAPDGAEIVEAKWELDMRFRYAKVCIHLTLAGCCAEFVIAAFERPRPDGSRLMWDALAMYRALGLTAQRHQAWKWVHNALPSWERLSAAGYGYLLRGAQVGEREDKDRDLERNIANTSLSTPLFVCVLARLLSPNKQCGGVADEAVRPAIRILLHNICCFVAGCSKRLQVFWDPTTAINKFPAPRFGSNLGSILLSPDGKCRVDRSEEVPDAMVGVVASLGLLTDSTCMVDVLIAACGVKSMCKMTFGQQFCLAVGSALESGLRAADEGRSGITFQFDESAPNRTKDIRLEQQLLRHLLASQEASKKHPGFISMSIDKSRVGSHGLQVAAGVLPDNVGFWMPPCVAASAPPFARGWFGVDGRGALCVDVVGSRARAVAAPPPFHKTIYWVGPPSVGQNRHRGVPT